VGLEGKKRQERGLRISWSDGVKAFRNRRNGKDRWELGGFECWCIET
jgi:hypothetical protein